MFGCLRESEPTCDYITAPTTRTSTAYHCGNKKQRHSVSQTYNPSTRKTFRDGSFFFAASESAFSTNEFASIFCAYIAWTESLHRVVKQYITRNASASTPTKPLDLPLIEADYLLLDQQPEAPTPGQRLRENTCRLGALFGSGWFFEWPGGKRPLNSTWPWADVKPSLLVLWGVCWMFVIPTLEVGSYQVPDRNRNNLGGMPSRNTDQYYFTPSATQSPTIVKRENISHTQNSNTLASDHWLLNSTSPLDNSYHHQNHHHYTTSPAPPQSLQVPIPIPMHLPMQSSDPRPGHLPHTHSYQHQHQAEATAPAMHRNTNPHALHAHATSPAQGSLRDTIHGGGRANTNTNDGGALAVTGISQIGPSSGSGSGRHINHQATAPVHRQQQHQQQPRRSNANYESYPHQNHQYDSAAVSQIQQPFISATNYPSFVVADMSSMYDNQRDFTHYPAIDEPQEHDDSIHQRYPSPGALNNPYSNQQAIDATISMELPELPSKAEDDPASPGRSRAIPKPDREVTKDPDGRFICTWAGCTEDTKTFGRKCEWSKHMDKHDRPYKCPADGCEKLPGFTYSGGLLRHEREVHNLHGGPRKQLNCPHPNCKRHSGKGFSRQENLNEHLRRVHTPGNTENGGDETEDDGSERAGMKRKRNSRMGDDSDIRDELARLRKENEDLRSNAERQHLETQDLMVQLQNLQGLVAAKFGQGGGGAPQAMM
ncbi:hypothetical protein HYFRA_00003533 [Hymenoscyphus fraxineus]|uniref:C2H2-type domain-containing protein n=1 Tax=Hymenoscyphus fraxineus TaxID=746836 RepID=A0A9N9KSY9_9HELO|nr:hypothetical protein HYFRA_00003533 [Hymenoscyphus fraxineus]